MRHDRGTIELIPSRPGPFIGPQGWWAISLAACAIVIGSTLAAIMTGAV